MVRMWACLSGCQWEVVEFKGRGCSHLSWKQLLRSLPWSCYPSLPNHERLLVFQQISSEVLSQYSWSSTLCLQRTLFSKLKPDSALFFNSTSSSLSCGSFLNIASLSSISTCWNSIHIPRANSRTCSFPAFPPLHSQTEVYTFYVAFVTDPLQMPLRHLVSYVCVKIIDHLSSFFLVCDLLSFNFIHLIISYSTWYFANNIIGNKKI